MEIDLRLHLKETPNYAALLALVERLAAMPGYEMGWRSAYNNAVIYVATTRPKEARAAFVRAYRKAPRFLAKPVELHLMRGGRRVTFSGRVGLRLTEREGHIYAHNVPGWTDDIYFNPARQVHHRSISSGLSVVFELGFSVMGPVAFDVRPTSIEKM